VAAPVFLVGLRLLQGLALGGEYGGAAAYVAEHAPAHRRGAYTAWIQTTATLGLLPEPAVILGTAYADRARRLRGLGLARALPAVGGDAGHQHLDPLAHGRVAGLPEAAGQRAHVQRAAVRDSFGRWSNLKLVLLALFGLVAGQAVVWYTGQLYALLYLHSVLKVDADTANVLVAVGLAVAAPFFVLFGAASDRSGASRSSPGCCWPAWDLLPLFKA
jgi:MFS family permease